MLVYLYGTDHAHEIRPLSPPRSTRLWRMHSCRRNRKQRQRKREIPTRSNDGDARLRSSCKEACWLVGVYHLGTCRVCSLQRSKKGPPRKVIGIFGTPPSQSFYRVGWLGRAPYRFSQRGQRRASRSVLSRILLQQNTYPGALQPDSSWVSYASSVQDSQPRASKMFEGSTLISCGFMLISTELPFLCGYNGQTDSQTASETASVKGSTKLLFSRLVTQPLPHSQALGVDADGTIKIEKIANPLDVML